MHAARASRIAKDLARAEEANSRRDSLDHARERVPALRKAGLNRDGDEEGRAEGDERVCPDTGGLSGPKAIPADRGARKRCDQEAEKEDSVACVRGEIKPGTHDGTSGTTDVS
jgi:hypothetical protein